MHNRTPLICRLGWHANTKVVRVRHLLHAAEWHGLKRPGSVVTFRCGRCCGRWQRVTYARLWRLEDVLRRE